MLQLDEWQKSHGSTPSRLRKGDNRAVRRDAMRFLLRILEAGRNEARSGAARSRFDGAAEG